MAENSTHVRDARYSDLPKIALLLSKAWFVFPGPRLVSLSLTRPCLDHIEIDWDNNLMGELLHPYRSEYPDDFNLYWLRQMRIFYWDWKSKFLVAVEMDSGGKEVRIAGYAHWERKGNDDTARKMTLWWFDPRRLLRPLTKTAIGIQAWLWPNRAADPSWIKAPDESYAHIDGFWAGQRGESWFLECLGIHPEYQGQGVGRKLVRWGLGQAETEGVCASVIVALGKDGFYERCGFDEQYGNATQGEGNPLKGVEGWNIWWKMPSSISAS